MSKPNFIEKAKQLASQFDIADPQVIEEIAQSLNDAYDQGTKAQTNSDDATIYGAYQRFLSD